MAKKNLFDSFSLTELFRPILTVCSLWQNKNLHPCIIANPHSGGFTIKSRVNHHKKILTKAAEEAANKMSILLEEQSFNSKKQKYAQIDDFPLYQTEYAGHAAFITQEVLTDALNSKEDDEFLIITAGGDGTSLEVLTALLKFALLNKKNYKLVTERICVLRLPFGTGNDGSDGRTIEETLKLLIMPSEFYLQKAIKVYYEGNSSSNYKSNNSSLDKLPPWYSFNIASVGIDAFITHNTNKFHKILPGDCYKLFVNLACLFYSWIYPSAKMHIELFAEDGSKTKDIEGNALFCLLGVSGKRTYGGGQKILPDSRNFCFTQNVSNIKKIFIKKKFLTGEHVNTKYAIMDNAAIIKLEYNKPILVQMDGEVHLLEAEHFPLIMEITEPIIKTIKLSY